VLLCGERASGLLLKMWQRCQHGCTGSASAWCVLCGKSCDNSSMAVSQSCALPGTGTQFTCFMRECCKGKACESNLPDIAQMTKYNSSAESDVHLLTCQQLTIEPHELLHYSRHVPGTSTLCALRSALQGVHETDSSSSAGQSNSHCTRCFQNTTLHAFLTRYSATCCCSCL
jgi:hypothetical protein